MPTPEQQRQPVIAPESGITLLEMLVVVTLIALMVGISFPSITTGLDSLRLRSAAGDVTSTFNVALVRADRWQEAVAITISPKGHFIRAESIRSHTVRRIDMPKEISILHIYPEPLGLDPTTAQDDRQYIVYPNGAVPRITFELANDRGAHRFVILDPITGVARERTELEVQAEQETPTVQVIGGETNP